MIDKKDLKIIFFGTPEFAVASLDALVTNGYNIRAVVTMPDKEAGRGHKLVCSDVKKYAIARNIEVLQPVNLKSEEFHNTLKHINADLFIVIAFRMLPETVWSMPAYGTFNLHASLLPDYRGAAPINRAIMNGETHTGVTTFFLKHDIDMGNIISQRQIEILPDENAGEVHDRLMILGASLVTDTVDSILNGSIKSNPQPEGKYTDAPKIFRNDCEIDWGMSSQKIHNHIRGLSPYPAAWSIMQLENGESISVKIFKSEVSEIVPQKHKMGEIIVKGKKMFVTTSDRLIEVIELQPAGKSKMEAAAFLQGYKPICFK